jgi:phosphopantetheinyl transferase (holo-ACP synthase)
MFAKGLLVCYAPRAAQTTRTASAALESWLHPRECDELQRYRDPAARDAWLAGRTVAKQLVLDALVRNHALHRDAAEVEICSRDDAGRQVRPRIRVADRLLPWCLSISHTANGVLAALSLDPRVRVGVDLAPLVERSAGFLRVWFTERERERLYNAGPLEIARYWAAKEAAYKAVNNGQSFAPRRVEVLRVDEAGERLVCRVAGCGRTTECTVETDSFGEEIWAIAAWPRFRSAAQPLTHSRETLLAIQRTLARLAAGSGVHE